jgi:hypothetical protein
MYIAWLFSASHLEYSYTQYPIPRSGKKTNGLGGVKTYGIRLDDRTAGSGTAAAGGAGANPKDHGRKIGKTRKR